jgi:hypothetical protein
MDLIELLNKNNEYIVSKYFKVFTLHTLKTVKIEIFTIKLDFLLEISILHERCLKCNEDLDKTII